MEPFLTFPEDGRPLADLGSLGARAKGPALAALIAYPEPAAEKGRLNAFLRLLAKAADMRGQQIPDLVMIDRELIVPVDARFLQSGANAIQKRISKRMHAGIVAAEPLLHQRNGMDLRHKLGSGRWNQAAALRTAAQRHGWEQKNFAAQYLRASRSVIHLAAAWACLNSVDTKQDPSAASAYLERLISDPVYCDRLIAEARSFEALVEQAGLGVRRAQLIEVLD